MRLRLTPVDREIAALGLPAMATLAADPLLSLVDTALVGRLGAVPLAALGINAAVFTTVFWVFNFLTYGTTAEVARLRGAAGVGGDLTAASRHALQALWLALGLGLALTLVLLAGAGVILALMGADGEVVEPARAYLRIRALAAVPVLVVSVGHGAFRGLKDTRTPLWVAVAANAANAAASYVLIYPVGLGVAGAAFGTLAAQTGAAVAFLVLARPRFPLPARADGRRRLGVDPPAMRAIVAISRDLFLRTASLLSALLVTTAIATRMGVVTVAAHQIARELWSMLALVLDGFAVAGQAMIGTSLGAGRPAKAQADARRLVGWGAATGTVIGLGYLALAGPLPRVFTAEADVLAGVASVWPLIAALQPVGGVVFILDGVLMGAGDFRFLLVSTAAAALGGLLPVALAALALGWGLPGLWAGMAALMGIRLVATTWRLVQGGWARPTAGEDVSARGVP